MSTFSFLTFGDPERGGFSRERWMVRADTMVARLRMTAAPASSVTDGGSLDTDEAVASANFWKAPNGGLPWVSELRITATRSPVLKVLMSAPTVSTVPA